MLPLQFEFGGDQASCTMRGGVARSVGVYSATLRGLIYDNRCLPRRKAGDIRWRIIGLVREGSLRVAGAGAIEAGTPFIAVDRMFAPIDEETVPVRSIGSTFSVVGVRLHPDLFTDPEPSLPASFTRASATSKAKLEEVGDAAEAGQTDELAPRLRAFVSSLADDGAVDRATLEAALTPPTDDPSVKRAGAAMFPVLFDLASRPMMVDLVDRAGVTERQMLRDIQRLQEDYDLFDRGWRDAVVRWRVTAAAVLLSSERMTTSQIATLVGYASTTAMGRAFREAGLPSPREVRRLFTEGSSAL